MKPITLTFDAFKDKNIQTNHMYGNKKPVGF